MRKQILLVVSLVVLSTLWFVASVNAGPTDPQWKNSYTILYKGDVFTPLESENEAKWNGSIQARHHSYISSDRQECIRLDNPDAFKGLGLPSTDGDGAGEFQNAINAAPLPTAGIYNTQGTYNGPSTLIEINGLCNTDGGTPVTIDSADNSFVWFEENPSRILLPIWTSAGNYEDDMLGSYEWDPSGGGDGGGAYVYNRSACADNDSYIQKSGDIWKWRMVWDNCNEGEAQISKKLVFGNDEELVEPPPVDEKEVFDNMPTSAIWSDAKTIRYDWDGDGNAEDFIKDAWSEDDSEDDYYVLEGNRCGIFFGTEFNISPTTGLESRLGNLSSTSTKAVAACAQNGRDWREIVRSANPGLTGQPLRYIVDDDSRFQAGGDGYFAEDAGIKAVSISNSRNIRVLFYGNNDNRDEATEVITLWENEESTRATGIYTGDISTGFNKPLGAGCGDDLTSVNPIGGGETFTWSAPVTEGSCNVSDVVVLVSFNASAFEDEELIQDPIDDDLIGFEDEDPNVSCEGASRLSLGWIVCPILEGLDEATGVMYGVVQKEMVVFENAIEVGEENTQNKPVIDYNDVQPLWQGFRNIARGLLIVALFIIIYAEIASTDVFAAYSVRKMLPKFLIAVVGIELSWIVFVEFAELVESVSQGIPDLMLSPFQDGDEKSLGLQINNTIANIAGGGAGLFVLYAIANPAFLLAILPTALAIVLALFAGFVVLVLRRMVLVTLLVIAPIALLLWIIPGTESLFKKWFQAFQNLLFMYPLVQLLIVAGVILSQVGGTITVNQDMPLDQSIRYLVAITAFFAPYFLIPYTFKFAGQAFSSIAGMVNDRTRGPIDRTRNWAKERRGEAKLDATNRLSKQDPNATGLKRLQNIRNKVAAGRALPPVGKRGEVNKLRQDLEAAKHELTSDPKYLNQQIERARMEGELLPAKAQEDEEARGRYRIEIALQEERQKLEAQHPNNLEKVKKELQDAAAAMAIDPNRTRGERVAALNQLADLKGTKQLEQIFSTFRSSGNVEEREIAQRTLAQKQDRIKQIAPHILGGMPAYHKITAQGAQKVTKDSLSRVVASGDKEAIKGLVNALNAAHTNPDLAQDADLGTAELLADIIAGKGASTPAASKSMKDALTNAGITAAQQSAVETSARNLLP